MVVCVILYLYYVHAHEPLKLRALRAQKRLGRVNLAVTKRLNSTSSKSAKRSNPALIVAGVRAFTSDELALATENFSKENLIGQGGYGTVYKGKLPDGKLAAIKRAANQPGGSSQGAPEFYNEIALLSRVHHKNLVTLEGYCDEEGRQMLVYEFMPGGTLRDRLFGGAALDFAARLRIALGAARGILYLHTEANPAIIHRDIKASNILLDDQGVAKVADFGLSCLATELDHQTGDHAVTPGHVSTVVKGTPGYLDPEYYMTQKLTDRSDVYSFGVVMLELVTGRRAITEGKNIVQEAYKRVGTDGGELLAMVDPTLLECTATSEVLDQFMELALRCCRARQEDRPTIGEVVRDLEAQLGRSTTDQLTSNASLVPAATPAAWRDFSPCVKLPYASPDSGGGGSVWSDESMMRVSPR